MLAVPLLEAPHEEVVLLRDGALGPLAQRPLRNFVARLDVVANIIELGQARAVGFSSAQRLGQETREAAVRGDDFPLDVLREPRERAWPLHGRGTRGGALRRAPFALAPNFSGQTRGSGEASVGVKKHRSAGGGGPCVALTRPVMFEGL